ncbi:MAG: hypothetical protein ACP5SI_12250 [Chloroflexia bacterium]
MVEVRFYGKLRRYGENPKPDALCRRLVPVVEATTVQDLVEQIGIARTEIAHVFLNGKLLLSVSPMALWLRYPEHEGRLPFPSDRWQTPVVAGDRIALFGQDMGLLVV